ncbi:Pleckstrin homology domain-domain-containing protein [Kockovaella imperatae]|uniref:Pleckstrin homology domain-domain-containing protein n=1 Tax=Kockovaella imperatae TaxID=4999 RepID=A0A1Y1UM46_9TREE|nr:Pleckstrin homology domain-domain-containing protein [Kockovaella imperatae]ORX39121.1 Pleckstrin homology domain-domain-containing protein [Kockovaella imperatae]
MQSQVHLAPAPAHQVTLSSSEDKDDEDICPVCCESLSFTFRLPGEKPHIVPECGHALHEECFSTVYGDVKPGETKRNLGVCGVCRQPMRISEGASYKRRGKDSESLKMAKLMGQNTDSSRGAPPTLASPADIASPSSGSQPEEIDLNADDPLTDPYGMNSSSSRSLLGGDGQPSVVIPSISIKAEHSYISRTYRKGKHAITAVISVKVPSAGDRGRYAARTRPDFAMSRSGSAEDGPQLPPSPRSASSHPTDISSVPASARSLPPLQGPDPFAHVLVDLQNRVVSYHTSGLDALGQLRLFDLLAVRKGTLVREFHVYLFQDAIICIVEERKSTMRKIFSSSSSVRSSDSSHSTHGKGILKMKGRIYVKHVQRITDSSVPGELSLTIEMEDPTMESFILVFRDRGSHETWKRNLNSILEEAKSGRPPPLLNREESNAKVAKLMGIGAPPAPKSASSSRGFASPVSQPSPNAMGGINFDLTPQPSATSYDRSALTPKSPFATSPLAELAFSAPLAPVHTPLDLVIILSLPAPSQTGTLPLKVRLMRQSLQFILAVMGIRDRVALVVCEMGSNGVVRKTPFLNTTRADSRHRLETFVDLLGSGQRDSDEFAVPVGREEKQDVVTAVNTALDVVLQRKVKNPLSGMILISDTSENIKRAQMELVTARLDAANIPVHAIGYGKGHDPSPLWMISNHTHGTYTYVREWYHLRDSLAGIVGSMMSVAMTNMKLHINCQDNEFKVLKVSGASQAIVSTGGKYADVELRELRHGETRELLVEMDFVDGMDEHRYSGDGSDESGGPPIGGGSARGGQLSVQGSIHKSTSIGNLGLALDNLSVADANNMMYEDALIDEIPVTEVDCSYHDPAANRSVTRLAHPILLTTAILPSNAPPSSAPAESLVVRRRMELLASDMITRALLIASRKNFEHAIKILKETKNIIEKISENLQTQLSRAGGSKSRREGQNLQAVHGLSAVGSDLDTLIDALEEHQDMFERDMRNFAAQQAVVLRTQKSWTTRTPSERMYCTPEVQHFVQMSGDWQGGK